MKTEIEKTQEIVIQGDQLFRRESFLTPLDTMDKVLHDMFNDGAFTFMPLTLPPMLRKWVKGHIFGMSPKKDTLLCFTEISYIPFVGANIRPVTKIINPGVVDGDEQGEPTTEFMHYVLNPGSRGTNDLPIPNDGWAIPEHSRAFIMIPWGISSNRSGDPYLFFISDKYAEPVAPKIPNLFPEARICTGYSYENRNDVDVKSHDKLPLHHIKHLLNVLHDAPANGDLRKNDHLFIQWDAELKEIPIPFSKDHYHTVTDVRIVEFFKWMKGNHV